MVLSQEGVTQKNLTKRSKKWNAGSKKATPTKALPLQIFETGLGHQSGEQCA